MGDAIRLPTRHPTMKALTFFILSALIFSSMAYATLVSITANIGSSRVGDTIRIYASYYDGAGGSVSDGTCTISGGTLSAPAAMPYNALGYYQYDLYLSNAGMHTYSVSCSKTGADTATGSFVLDLPKGQSSLSIVNAPGISEIGNKVSLQASYLFKGSKISGGACNIDIVSPDGSKDTRRMNEGGYYTTDYIFSSGGKHTFLVSCSSDNYLSQSQSFSMDVLKRPSSLAALDVSPTYYAGSPVKIHYSYKTDKGSGAISDAQCSFELRKDSQSVMSGKLQYSSTGYLFSADNLDAADAPYSLKVSCESPGDALQSASNNFQVLNVPTSVRVTRDAPNGEISNTPLNIEAAYFNSATNSRISDGTCTIALSSEGAIHQGSKLETRFPAVDGAQSITVDACCTKKNHQQSCNSLYLTVYPQPVVMELLPAPSEFVAGGKYTIGIRAAPAYYGSADGIQCDADLRESSSAPSGKYLNLSRTGAAYSTDIYFEQPERLAVTYTCFGKGYARSQMRTEIRIKVFNKESESQLTSVLVVTALVLLSALVLIKRRYKV